MSRCLTVAGDVDERICVCNKKEGKEKDSNAFKLVFRRVCLQINFRALEHKFEALQTQFTKVCRLVPPNETARKPGDRLGVAKTDGAALERALSK